MDDRIIELLYRNLQEVFGEGDAARRRAAIEDFYTEDCVLYVPPGSLLDTTLWTSSPETSARHIPTSSIRLMERHKLSTMRGFWHGAQARKARHQNTPDWMSSLFVMARSLRSTSFSIPNLHSGRDPLRLAFASKRSSELQEASASAPAIRAGRATWQTDNDTTLARISSSNREGSQSANVRIGSVSTEAANSAARPLLLRPKS